MESQRIRREYVDFAASALTESQTAQSHEERCDAIATLLTALSAEEDSWHARERDELLQSIGRGCD